MIIMIHHTSIAMASNDQIYFDLGVFALQEGDTETARQNFEKALMYSSENPLYLYYLGKTELDEKKYEVAQNRFALAWQLSPEIPGLAFDIASAHFYQKSYKQAAKLYEIAIDQDTDAEQTVIAHFRAGIAFFYLNEFELAIPHLLHAAETTPSLKDAGFFYAGICFYHQHDWTLAHNYLNQVKMHALNKSLRRQASKWLQAVEMGRLQFKPYDLYFKLGFGYDDNVSLFSPDADVDSDDALNTLLLFGRYHLINEAEFKMGVGYGHYQSTHLDTSDANLINSNLIFYATTQNDTYQWNTSLMPSYFWLNSNRFLQRTQLRTCLSLNVENVIVPHIYYAYTMDNHFQDENRDANRHGIGLGVSFMFDPDLYQLQTRFSSDKISSAHRNHNYENSNAQLYLNVFAHPKCTLKLFGRCGFRNHEHQDTIHLIKREDKQYQAQLGIEVPLKYKGFHVEMNYQWAKNDSNIHVYDYRKNLLTVFLTVRQ
jgi:tetratricopeptide (TPR) repeat protein